jgi:hypothetical protein
MSSSRQETQGMQIERLISQQHKYNQKIGTETEPELLRHIPWRRISRESGDRVSDSNKSTIGPPSQAFVMVMCLEPHPHIRNNLYLRTLSQCRQLFISPGDP